MSTCTLGENAPGGQFYQWLCITAPHFSTTAGTQHDEKLPKPKPAPQAPVPESKICLTRAAEILKCGTSRLSELCKAGKIPCERIGRFVFLRIEDVQRYRDGAKARIHAAQVANAAKARAVHYGLPQN